MDRRERLRHDRHRLVFAPEIHPESDRPRVGDVHPLLSGGRLASEVGKQGGSFLVAADEHRRLSEHQARLDAATRRSGGGGEALGEDKVVCVVCPASGGGQEVAVDVVAGVEPPRRHADKVSRPRHPRRRHRVGDQPADAPRRRAGIAASTASP